MTEVESLVKQAIGIVRSGKISERAEKLLTLALDNIRHPEPRMLRDVLKMSEKERSTVDFDNCYLTLDELCETADVSKTTVRTLVNDGYLEQHHRGLYRLSDFCRAWGEYQERPR